MFKKNKKFFGIAFVLLLAALLFILGNFKPPKESVKFFSYTFDVSDTLEEAGSAEESTSPFFWLNSGGEMIIKDGLGSTIVGDLPENSKWRKLYSTSDPTDTDLGLHPQNIFRLLTRDKFSDVSEEASFLVKKIILSQSPNRNESNGFLLFARYIDSDNLYYAGIRVDGAAVIKKKINGTYYKMAEKNLLLGQKYDREAMPNKLPLDTWVKLRLEVKTLENDTVNIKLYSDFNETHTLTEIFDVNDTDGSFGGKAHYSSGALGIRTDFMEVYFDNFSVQKL